MSTRLSVREFEGQTGPNLGKVLRTDVHRPMFEAELTGRSLG